LFGELIVKQAYVLLSGGIDSAACLRFLKNQEYTTQAIFVDYGQLSRAYEMVAARAIADHFNTPLTLIRLVGASRQSAGEIAGRNAFLLMTGLLEIGKANGVLALGVHAGTPYYDCTPNFIDEMQVLFDLYTDGRIRIVAPFLDWTKQQIWQYACISHVPLDLTYSCERGENQPCNLCSSCADLRRLRC